MPTQSTTGTPCTVLTRIRAPAAIVFDDRHPPRRLFKHALIEAETLVFFKDMLVSDIDDYGTENIFHPSKNMSTYGTKLAFLLKNYNNKTS